MTRSRPAAAVAAAGVMATVVVVGLTSPAGAATGPTITFHSPASNAVVTGDPTISGDASMPGFGDTIGNIRVSLTSAATSDLPAPCDPCNPDRHGQSESFSWSPSLPRNGPYQAHVTAGGSQFVLGVLQGEGQSEATLSFRMEIPPADPTGVRAEAKPDQSVRVSWTRNREPDMIAYRVQRKDPGASSFHDVGGAVAQPPSGGSVSIVDSAAGPGGTFVYQVQAIRAGRSGDGSTAVGSGFSSAEAAVPAPATAGSGAPGGPPPGPAQNAPPTPSLSAFLKGSGGPPKASLPSAPSLPDGGFQENLPFAIPPGGRGRAGDQAVGLSGTSSGNGARAVLIPVAGGFLLCLVAFHVRRLNGFLTATPSGKRSRPPAATRPLAMAAIAAPAADQPTPRRAIPAATWLLTQKAEPARPAPKPSEASSGVRILDDTAGTAGATASFERWLKGSGADLESDQDDDDTKWAPLTTPTDLVGASKRSGDDTADLGWDSILVKPGAGTTHRR